MTREETIEAFAEAAHEAWLVEKMRRLRAITDDRPLTWPSETGEEQLISWRDLSESVRDFDRIVVGAIYDVMSREGLI